MYIVLGCICIFFLIWNRYIYYKYKCLSGCLSKYEELINKYRLDNHENKNQLLFIRNLKSYHKIKDYIDSLLGSSDDKDIDKLLKQIPSDYLRAVLYSKIATIKEKGINISIYVSKEVTSKLFIGIDNGTIYDVCNIISIIMDNAIDEGEDISICFSKSKYLEITISNMSKNVDIGKIFEVGYSSKGEGHGYGLAKMKEIVKKNKKIINEVSYDNNIFSQIVKIKLTRSK